MDISSSIPTVVKSVAFSFLTPQEVRRVSVKQLINPQLLDHLNRPTVGGLYDPALGPAHKQDICGTCNLTYFTCPGHFGHIELPSPVFHPLFMAEMFKVLQGTCLFCHHFKMPRVLKAKFAAQLRLLEKGLVDAAMGVDDVIFSAERSEGVDAEGDLTMRDESDSELEDNATTASGTSKVNPSVIERKLDAYVTSRLSAVQSGSQGGGNTFHDGIVYQMRKKIYRDVFMNRYDGCGNCGAKGYTFRKEGWTKVIEYDLKAKHKEINLLLGLGQRPNVLADALPSNYSTENPDAENDSSTDDDGEDIAHSDDERPRARPDEDTEPETQGPIRDYRGKVKGRGGRAERFIAPDEARAHLRRLFSNEAPLTSLMYGAHSGSAVSSAPASADMFFIECLSVPPTRFRPPAQRDDQLMEHPQNTILTKVLHTGYRIRDLSHQLEEVSAKEAGPGKQSERERTLVQLVMQLVQLQEDVNSFIDSTKSSTKPRAGVLPPPGVKNILEKKDGLFRMNMMGKRVNYAARSVISPDVNIESNEIGIPPVFARKLTFPEPVTHQNVHVMRNLVINGPNKYPGASFIQMEDGSQQSLVRMYGLPLPSSTHFPKQGKLSVEQRTALANQLLTPQEGSKASTTSNTLTTRTLGTNKKVYRHLVSGDSLILNRQPTLHKPSMMVHKAKVLVGEKTIRMHYANCNSYNADFDGDEMNIHFPQSQVARAEARFLANTDNQYLVPTSGMPLRGLIQDHVVAGVWMTYKETFFERWEYQQLLYGALKPEDKYSGAGRIFTVPPAIWKPKPLWTGKQIISTIMKNITPPTSAGMHLHSQSKILNTHWGAHRRYSKDVRFQDGSKMTMKLDGDQSVIFYDGDLLCGVLDKSQYGATAYGMVHSVYELYGAEVAGKLLSILSRLFTKFLQHRAFTCRMDDLLLTPDADTKRKQTLANAKGWGHEAAISNFPALKEMDPNSPVTDKQLRMLLEEVSRDDSKMNDLDVTVKKKMAGLTQAVATGAIPNGLYRKFPNNHMQTMVMSGAKGSAVNARQISCGLGQTELEGRRVPVMVSGKTLPSFKPLETAAIAGGYIASRFLTGIKPQEFYFHCMAGREGLIDTAVKTSRSGYLQRCLIKHLEGIRVHYDNTVRGSDSSVYQFLYGGDGLDVTKQMHLTQFDFAAMNTSSLVQKANPEAIKDMVNDDSAAKHMKKVLKHPDEPERYDPTLSVYPPTRYLGSTSEGFANAVDKYIKSNAGKTLKAKKEQLIDGRRRNDLMSGSNFKMLMNLRYMRALAEPGEAIGLLAAQGVGEPSTQMTLNTFHFAGHGAANVTLGIPRLREIVMTASIKPKTPTMTLPQTPGMDPERVQRFCKKASRVSLSDIVETVNVTEKIIRDGLTRRKSYDVKLLFYPPEQYKEEYLVKPRDVLNALATSFPAVLKRELTKELKKLGETIRNQEQDIGKGKKAREHGDGNEGDDSDAETPTSRQEKTDSAAQDMDDDSDKDEADDEDEKSRAKRKQQATYSDESGESGAEDDQDDLERALDSDHLDSDTEPPKPKAKSKQSWKRRLVDAQILFEKLGSPFTSSLRFPETGESATFNIQISSEKQKLLLVGVIEQVCLKSIIRQIPGVNQCREFIPENKSEGPKFMTEGSNLKGLWGFCHDEGELNGIESNDIAAMLHTYGVEAARETIIREMSSVFGVYNIKVDPRHLMIIADYMTFDGGFKPFSRAGIATSSSVLLKASYEMTGSFLADATLHGDFDELTSPASSIVLGQPAQSGTGLFGIRAPVSTSA